MKQFIFLAVFLFASSLPAQSIREHTDALATNIIVSTENSVFSTGSPILIKRSEGYYHSRSDRDVDFDFDTSSSYGYDYGYGYTSWHLEFVGNRDISTSGKKYRLSFINSEGQNIGIIRVQKKEINVIAGLMKPPFFYSVDLKEVPILLLEQTARIDINPY